jgi:hypothetical protein
MTLAFACSSIERDGQVAAPSPEVFPELLRLEEKRFVQGVSYFTNKIPTFI